MNRLYRERRLYWHHLKNFDKPGIDLFGVDEIITAGLEFQMCDFRGKPRNLFIAASSNWDSGLYFEKERDNDLGAIIGEDSKIFRYIINNLLNEAGELTYNMESYKRVPRPPKLNFVTFFALGHGGCYYKTLTYNEVHCKEHPYYPLFIYSKQLIGEMQRKEYARLQAQSKEYKKTASKKGKKTKK